MRLTAGAALAAVTLSGAIALAAPQPPALYTATQATAGEGAYLAACAACHGVRLEGGAGPPLSGERFRTRTRQAHLRVGDVFSAVAKQMPLNQPASLPHERYVAIMAYLLKENGYPSGTAALAYDGALRSKVVMTSYRTP